MAEIIRPLTFLLILTLTFNDHFLLKISILWCCFMFSDNTNWELC